MEERVGDRAAGAEAIGKAIGDDEELKEEEADLRETAGCSNLKHGAANANRNGRNMPWPKEKNEND